MGELTHIDLFSGIGGFALACRWNGIRTIQMVEIDPFCQKVLNKNFLGVPIEPDIKQFDGKKYAGSFILTGGFPCQPFSCAGKRNGKEDDRFLWPEMLRVISEVRPRWIIGENVAGIINMELDNCISDLEREGYEVQTFIIPACAVNAPHRRDRVWIVAHSTSGGCFNGSDNREERYIQDASIGTVEENQSERGGRFDRIEQTDCHAPDTPQRENNGRERRNVDETERSGECGDSAVISGDQDVSNSKDERLQGSLKTVREERAQSNDELLHGCGGEWNQPWIEVATRLCRVDDGTAEELYKLETSDRVARLKALGNAIVPQVAGQIIKAILNAEKI